MIEITVYIDILFFENLIMNAIILYATGIILKIKPRLIRVMLASIFGSIYVIISYITQMQIYTSIVLKGLLAIVMIYIAFNPQNIIKMWKQLAIFYLTSFVFGGATLYLIYFIKPQETFIKNGIFSGKNILKIIMLGAIVALIVIKISLKIIKTKINIKDIYCKIKFNINDKIVETKAMIDTGNLAKEPITNIPVVIVERSLLQNIIPNEILDNLENILGGDFSNIPEEVQKKYIPKLRCIPFTSLGKQHGMLVGIKIEKIEIETEYESKISNDIILGIYDKSLTKRGEYRALIGLELI